MLLIDGDLRRPSVSRWFGIEAKVGLTQVLRGDASLRRRWSPCVARAGCARLRTGAHAAHRPTIRACAAPRRPRARGVARQPRSATRRTSAAATLADAEQALRHCDHRHGSDPRGGGHRADAGVGRRGARRRAGRGHDAGCRRAVNEIVARVPNANFVGVVANDVRDTFLEGSYGGCTRGAVMATATATGTATAPVVAAEQGEVNAASRRACAWTRGLGL